ncbi:hypothetical protein RFI_33347, partial [Reticulomyxa filosa]
MAMEKEMDFFHSNAMQPKEREDEWDVSALRRELEQAQEEIKQLKQVVQKKDLAVNELKTRYSDISIRQKQMFQDTDKKRKEALQKGKEYKDMYTKSEKEKNDWKQMYEEEKQKRQMKEQEYNDMMANHLKNDQKYHDIISKLQNSLKGEDTVQEEMKQAQSAIDNVLL